MVRTGHRTQRRRGGRRLDRVAFLGPIPPAATGVATYDRAVLEGLGRIGVTPPVEPIWPVDQRAAAIVPEYRLAVYQMGNSVEHHLEIFRLLWRHPGLVVLHDLAIDGFVRGMAAAGDVRAYASMHREAIDAGTHLDSPDVVLSEPLRMPWVAAVARRARGLVVHSDFGRRYLEELGCRTPTFVIPHPPVETEDAIRVARTGGAALRDRARAKGADTLVVVPGELNGTKGLDAIIEAAVSLQRHVHIVMVGRNPAFDVAAAIAAAGVADRVRVELDVSDATFLAWIAAADIVVELRHPHRGEVSGSLSRAMQVGRPVIVSGTGSYLDAPAEAVSTISPGPPDPSELLERISALAADADRCERMGAAGRAFTEELIRSEATAKGYAAAIAATLGVVEDPTRRPRDRWAGALAEIGVTQDHVEAGFGMSYARALESFTHPT